ncbi:MAG: Hsp70 family protein [Bdellovibrionales bacterium]|nr:Hsp70 family protein [Bdellovibrionales bacterium]
MSNSLIYAIDFGTSNSLLSAAQQQKPLQPIALDRSNSDPTILRSLMYFPKKGAPSFGRQAIEQYTKDSAEGRFIRSIKKYLPAKSFQGTQIGGKVYGLEDLISCFLTEMKSRADQHFNEDVRSVVLGKPARFSMDDEKEELAKKRLVSAAVASGFKHVEFLPEPLAAAFSYRKQVEDEQNLLVVDLGGGTSDFTVIRLHHDRFRDEDVLAIGGVSVAGDALDGEIMAEIIAPNFGSKIQYQFPMSSNVLTMPPILKHKLSSPADITLMGNTDIMEFLAQVKKCNVSDEAKDQLEQLFVLINDNLGFALFSEIEKSKVQVCAEQLASFAFETDEIWVKEQFDFNAFADVVAKKIASILNCLDETVKHSGLSFDEIDLICMTGGTSKVPLIRTALTERFGERKISTFNSFHSVIQGLAERAAQL